MADFDLAAHIVDLDPGITTLDLSFQSVDDLTPLAGLTGLQSLDLQSMPVDDLAPLAGLTGLQSLDLRSTPVDDLTPLAGLTGLQSLNLFNTQVDDLAPLAGLTGLQSLDLQSTPVDDLTPLAGLTSLRTLSLRSTRVTDLSPLNAFSQLRALDLERSLVSNLSPLDESAPLSKLDISGTRVRFIPDWLLNRLTLVAGQGFLYTDGNLVVTGCPLDDPPMSLVAEGMDRVRAYRSSTIGERRPLGEVRLIFVGDGAAGKTSLSKHLHGEDHDPAEPTTEGIRITDWAPDLPGGDDVTVHVWDFGGQEVLHATHKFFLSHRCVYVVVLDGRKEERPEYWLDHVHTFGGDAPVLVVLNKQDQRLGYEVGRKELLRKYPNIVGFYPTSCKPGEEQGLDAFAEAIVDEVEATEGRHMPIAENWAAVKAELEAMDEPYLNADQYRQLCLAHGIEDEVARSTLLILLDQLGTVLAFDDPGLNETQVLDSKWLTGAVYRLLTSDAVKANGGLFDEREMADLLAPREPDDPTYPAHKHRYIVGMMEKFELCYRVQDQGPEILVPDLLPEDEPDYAFDTDDEGLIRFEVHYPFFPSSIVTRFIVACHEDIAERWRSGMVLQDEIHEARVLVRADRAEGTIRFWIEGVDKRAALSVLRKRLDRIHRSFEALTVEERVPLPRSPGFTVPYRELVGLERMGEPSYPHGQTGERYRVAELLDGIERPFERAPMRDPSVRIDIHNDVKAVSAAKADASAHAEISIQQVRGAAGDLRRELEDALALLPASGEDADAVRAEITGVLAKLETAGAKPSPEAVANSEEITGVRRFLDRLADDSTRLGKVFGAIEGGAKRAKAIGETYNLFCPLLGFPPIPPLLLGKRPDQPKGSA